MHKAFTGRLQAISAFSALKSTIVPSTLGPRLRPLHTGKSPNHTPDTYLKEVDTTPINDKTVNVLDPDSDSVQLPDEPPSGPWSRAGAMTEEYTHVESGEAGKQPYAPTKGRYGAKGDWEEKKGGETSTDAKSNRGRL